VYPDGSKMLTGNGRLDPLPDNPSPLATNVVSTVTSNLGVPAFSPDGLLVAFNPMAGPITSPTQKLVVMSFANATNAFSNPQVVVDDSATGLPETRPGWQPGRAIVDHQTAAGSDGNGLGDLRT